MGNIFANSSNQQILRLEGRIKDLEGIDQNRDGVVTKSELIVWQQQQQQLMDQLRKQISENKDIEYQEKMNQYNIEIDTLNKEVSSLKSINHNLEKQLISKHTQTQTQTQTHITNNTVSKIELSNQLLTELSEQRIYELVERWIENEKINIHGFPDFIERHIYRNVVRMLVSLLKEVLETTSVEILGHKIGNLTLQPIPTIQNKRN